MYQLKYFLYILFIDNSYHQLLFRKYAIYKSSYIICLFIFLKGDNMSK